ncbi:MAG: hypothetical protein U9N46_01460 [Euryarchaeota archaeon]|nr:hypothetical protein [Euryarchaeota archaeon]
MTRNKTPPHIKLDENPDDFSDLTKASESTLEFWDNPIDCEEWNGA